MRRELAQLSHPYNGEDLTWHKVAPAMGKLSCQGPEVCAELKEHDIASFFQRKPGEAPSPLGAILPWLAGMSWKGAFGEPSILSG